MEHRYNKRFPADHKALIFKNGMPVAIGRVCNFSRGGIFVKTEFDLIEVNQSLDVELLARSNNRTSTCSEVRCLCKALVMHKSNGGVGLMMREECAETQQNYASFIAEEFERFQNITGGAGSRISHSVESAAVLVEKH